MTRAESYPEPIPSASQTILGGEAHLSVIRLRGEHDIATVPALAATLSRAVAAGGADVVVDLGAVEFMDASTIGVIVGARKQLARQSRALTVRSPSVSAQRVLDACGLRDLLDPPSGATGATPMVGPSGALGTWVAVAATDRAERPKAVADTDRRADPRFVPAPAAEVRRSEGRTEATTNSAPP